MGLIIGRMLGPTVLLSCSGHNDIVDLVQNSVGSHHIAFSNSGILDLRTAIACNAKMMTRDGFDGAHKWPIGGNDASTADHIVDNMRLDLSHKLGLTLCGRPGLAGLAQLIEYIVLGHQERKAVRIICQQMGQVRLADQFQEFGVVRIDLQRFEQVLSGRILIFINVRNRFSVSESHILGRGQWAVQLMQHRAAALVIEVDEAGTVNGGPIHDVREEGMGGVQIQANICALHRGQGAL